MSIWSKFHSPSTLKRNSDYEEVTQWLFKQFPSYQVIGSAAFKPTLQNIEQLLARFNNPHHDLKFIHVAGSNGKGSVCSLLSSILTESGKKVGLFTSPHIVDFTERIRINGQCIDQQSVIDFVKEVRATPLDFEPSFFEITFAMSIVYFKNMEVDICVIETGLGGRLDATNIIRPLCSIITSISLEHTAILGDTVEAIAEEKGGIIKPDTPVVVGKLQPSVLDTLKAIADQKRSPFYESRSHSVSFDLPFIADYQLDNFNLVMTCIDSLQSTINISEQDIQKGLNNLFENTGYIGRLQIIQENPRVIMDVSHNPDGILKSLDAITKHDHRRLRIIYGSSNDKEVNEILKLFPLDAKLYFTTFTNSRSKSLDNWNQIATVIPQTNQTFDSAKEAYSKAIEDSQKNDIIWITGSFFLLSDFF